MKNTKTSSLLRLVAFLLITVILIGAVGLVSEGMNQVPDTNPPSTEKNDESTGGEDDSNDPPPPSIRPLYSRPLPPIISIT